MRSTRLAALITAAGLALAAVLSLSPSAAVARPDAEPGSPIAIKPRTDAEAAALSRALDVSAAFQAIARDVTPAVVSIQAEVRASAQPFADPFGGFDPFRRAQPQRGISTGSGVLVSDDGYVLTNNHVVENALAVRVTLDDGRALEGRVIGTDPKTDVALLKVNATGLPHARLGDSDAVNVGEMVVAIGSPFGLSQTVTSGIISAKGRRLDNGTRGNVNAQFEDFLQTDAAINPGNSGGPLVNLRGEVVGINTAIFSRSGGYMGIGFAIPANIARGVMESLINTGSVQRGYLGVRYSDLTPSEAQRLGYNGTQGVVVSTVVDGGPAAAAGLKPSDIITDIDGKPVRDGAAFRTRIATMPPERTVTLGVVRAGERKTLSARLEPTPAPTIERLAAEDNELGVPLRTVDDDVRDQLGDRGATGVVILQVTRSSLARRIGLTAGDVITSINGTPVLDTESFTKAMDSVDMARGLVLGFRRAGQNQTVTIRINR